MDSKKLKDFLQNLGEDAPKLNLDNTVDIEAKRAYDEGVKQGFGEGEDYWFDKGQEYGRNQTEQEMYWLIKRLDSDTLTAVQNLLDVAFKHGQEIGK